MSPKIALLVNGRSWTEEAKNPRDKVTQALGRVEDQGVPLRYKATGVHYSPTAGGWVTTSANWGVDVVGAVLLAYQPEPDPGEANTAVHDPSAAAALFLAVPYAYVAGLSDGWDRDTQSAVWLSNLQKHSYMNGYEAGMEARFRATVVCSCGCRRFRVELGCPSCEESGR